MSEAWSQLRDVDRLSDDQVELDFSIPLTAFPRLPTQVPDSGETLRGHARFGREGGLAVADLVVEGGIQLVCQRCLTPMRQAIRSHARIALVASEAEADRVPPQFEPVRAPEGRIRLRDLVEEEVLLSLPVVPLHADPRDCASAASDAQAETASSVQKPFERLGELLKRK